MVNTELKKEEILKALWFRHATQVYDDSQKISAADFEYILEAGRLSPSSMGLEPWKFIVIQNPELRGQLMELAQGARHQLPTASHFGIFIVRNDLRYDSPYVVGKMKNLIKAPDDVFKSFMQSVQKFQTEQQHIADNERTLFDWSAKQSYIALANMMAAAALIGIDSSPIEGFNQEQVRSFMKDNGLIQEEYWVPSLMAAFGYRGEAPRYGKIRRPMEEVVIWA